MIYLQRVYEKPLKPKGFAVLVDRLWPRGISKEQLSGVLWFKEIAPSTELRKWFNHDPAKWPDFKKKYVAEIKANPALAQIKEILKQHKEITFLYGAKDEQHNEAVVLKDYLEK